MSETGVGLGVILALTGLLFGALAAVFAVKKEKACALIAGFNLLTKEQQAGYDRAAMARDYQRLFTVWTAGAFVFALLCPWLCWWAFGAATALFLFSIGKEMHIDYEKAFAKYKIK